MSDAAATSISLHRVVITGMGVVAPNGVGVEEFRDAIFSGRSGISRIAAFDPSSLRSQVAGQVAGFEPSDYLPAREVRHVSRAVPMALAAARELLATSGLDVALDDELRTRVGVILGSGGGGIEFTERQYQNYFLDQKKDLSLYNVPSSTMGSLSSEISMACGLHGPSHVISTGCTSSSDAMGYALLMLRSGRLQGVITGGVDATITPALMEGFSMMKILSTGYNEHPEQSSRPFEADRDGFVLSEGAWLFSMETLESAIRRRANILAEICGYGSVCEAFHRVRMDESGQEPARAMREALADAGMGPADIDYIQLHGTGTRLNDRVETKAVKLCFGDDARRIPMGSVKSMIGHPQGASGASGVAAALLAIKDNVLPPTINLDSPDVDCDLDYVSHEARPHKVRIALGNCMGFGSKCSAIVIRKFEN